jgi:hypothetical protein
MGQLRGIHAHAAFSPRHAQQAAVMHAVQELRTGPGVAAEPVLGRAVLEGGVDLARVNHAATLHKL